MDQQLKTRLIGATIIMSLLVIFVPMLFEDSSEQAADVTTASAPEFPQEFDSQALPLPSTAPKPGLPAPVAGAGGEYQPLPSPSRDEPLDPLDVQPSTAGTAGQADDMAGLEPVDTGADFAPAKAPAPRPAAKAPASNAEAAPPKPQVMESKPAEKLKSVVVPAPAKESIAKAAPAPTPSKPKAVVAPTPAKTANGEAAKTPGKLSAWVVQAGSFSDEANAKTLVAKLRQAKIPAFMEMVPGPQGNSYRVRVGPEAERAKAEVILKKMDSDAGVKGMIVSYP